MKNSLLLQQDEHTSLKTQLRVLGVLTFILSLFLTITILSYTQSDKENGSIPIQALFGFIDDVDDFRAKVEISQNKLGLPGAFIANFCVDKTLGYWSIVLSFLLVACSWEIFVNGFLGYNYFRRSFWILLLAICFSTVSSLLRSSFLPIIPQELSGTMSNFIANSLIVGIGKIGAFVFVAISAVVSIANIATYGISGLYLSKRKQVKPSIPEDVLRAQAQYYLDIYSTEEEPIEVLRSTIEIPEEVSYSQDSLILDIEHYVSEKLPSALVPIDEVEDLEIYEEEFEELQPIEVLDKIEEYTVDSENPHPYEEFEQTSTSVIGTIPTETKEVFEDNLELRELEDNVNADEQIESKNESVDRKEEIEVIEEIEPNIHESIETDVNISIENQFFEELISEQDEFDDENQYESPISFENIDLLNEESTNQFVFMPQLGETMLPDFEELSDIELDPELDIIDENENISLLGNFEVTAEERIDFPTIESVQLLDVVETIPIDLVNLPIQNELPFEYEQKVELPIRNENSTKTKYLVDFSNEVQQSNLDLLRTKLEIVHIPFSSLEQNDTLLTTIYTLHFSKSFDRLQSETLYHEIIDVLKAPGVVIESFLQSDSKIEIEIPKKNIQEIIKDVKIQKPSTRGILPIDVGFKNNGELIRFDLSDYYNVLIGGTFGSGKTSLLISIISTLAKNNDSVSVKFLPIVFDELPYINVKPIFVHSFATTSTDESKILNSTEILAFQAIKALYLETKKRLELFDRDKKTTISAFNYLKNPLEQLPYIVTIIDPIEILSSHKESKEYLSLILLCGAAVGIHTIAISKNVPSLDPMLIQRFPCKIASYTNSKTSSRLLLQSTSAEGLLNAYDYVLRFSSHSQNHYSRFFLSNEEIHSSTFSQLRADSYPYHLPFQEQKELNGNSNIDPLLLKIAEFVVKEQKAGIGSILHKFNISYEEAVTYITQLEKVGVLSQYKQNNRTVLVKEISELRKYL